MIWRGTQLPGDMVVIVGLGGLLLALVPIQTLAAYGRLKRGPAEIASFAATMLMVWAIVAALAFPDVLLTALLMAVTGLIFVFGGFVYYAVVRIGSGGQTLKQSWAARDVRTAESLAKWRAAKAARKH